jgi:guanylate kinase
MTGDKLRKLVADYKPSPQVLKKMVDIRVMGTVGPSASGKTTIMKALVKASPKIKLILDETSRPPRPNEVNGVDFLFRTKEEILEDLKNGELAQLAVGPNGDLYSTRLSSYPKNAVGLIPLMPAAVKEFRQLPLKSFQTAFIVPHSFEAWQEWLAKQAKAGNWNGEKLQSRLAEAKQSYEFALSDKEIHFVLNDEIDGAVRRLQQILGGQKPADEEQTRSIAKENYSQLLKLLNRSSNL